jgi:hypothetical protein
MKLYRHGNLRGMGRHLGLPCTRKHTGFPLLLIILFCSSGCSFGLLEGYQKAQQVSMAPVSWFKTDSDHLLMNTTIDLMKYHFSGVMVIKTLTNGGYRVVFITEVGLKIFDMEFVPGKPVQVYYFMDALNKKILIKTLSADLKLLLIQPQEDEKPVLYNSPSGQKMARYKHKRKRDYYEISALTGKPVQAYQVTVTSKKARIDYHSRDGMQIDSVIINHYHVNLRIGMHLINENSQDAAK